MAEQSEKYLDPIEEPAAETAATEKPAPAGTEAPPAADDPPARADGGKKRSDPANAPERPDGYVPKQALDQARNEYREELKREKEARERSEARFQQVVDRIWGNEPEPDPDAYTGPADDPLARLAWLDQREHQRIDQQRQAQQQTAQQTQQQTEWNEAFSKVNGDYLTAREADPTVDEAYSALRDSFTRELQALGWGRDPAGMAREGQRLEAWHVMNAHKQGIPIGDYLKALAGARGWKPAPKTEQQQADAQQQAQRDPATGQFARAQQIAESQERNASLSQAPGAPVKRMSAKELAQMPEDEMWRTFNSVLRRKGSKDFDYEMGYKS